MSSQLRLALIHATRLAMEPIEAAAQDLWPEAELVSILEEGLSMDRAANKVSDAQLNARIVELARYAEQLSPAGILYTCSAFGEGIEQAANTSSLPVLKPNEAMFEAAFMQGDKLAMIYTFQPSVASMEREFNEAAKLHGSNASLLSVVAEGALGALRNGDAKSHNQKVAEAARGIEGVDAIMLAQFSTAQAAPAVRDVTDALVLTSPESAVEKMKALVEQASTSGA